MRKIQLREAKAELSAVIDAAMGGEPAVITRHGKPQAVVVGFEEWQKLSRLPSFARLLLAAPEGIVELPARNRGDLRHSGLRRSGL